MSLPFADLSALLFPFGKPLPACVPTVGAQGGNGL